MRLRIGVTLLGLVLSSCSALLDLPAVPGGAGSGEPLPVPSGLKGTAGDASATLQWDAVPAASAKEVAGYRVYWRRSDGGGVERSAFVPAERQFEDVFGLVNDAAYTVQLTTTDSNGRASARSEPVTVTPRDPSATLTLSSSDPADGATDLPLTHPWVLRFSQPVETTTFATTVSPSGALSVVTWALSDTVVVLAPTAALTAGTSYSVSITAVSKTGASLSGAAQLTFTTAATPSATSPVSPVLVTTTPGHGAQNVPLPTDPVLTFSRPMDPETVEVTASPHDDLGLGFWDETRTTLRFPVAPKDFKSHALYTLRVRGKDSLGTSLAGPTRFSFLTFAAADIAAPTLIETSPSGDSGEVSPETDITVIFSEPMEKTSTAAAFSTEPPLPCVFRWNDDSTQLTCHPQALLEGARTYQVMVGQSASDLAGNLLGTPEGFSFTTAASPDRTAPKITTAILPSSSGSLAVEPASTLELLFSEPMRTEQTEAAFHLTAPDAEAGGTFSWNFSHTQLTFRPARAFPLGTTVGWRLDTRAKDIGGNPLAATVTGEFKIRDCAIDAEILTKAQTLGSAVLGRCRNDSADATDGGRFNDFEKGSIYSKAGVGTFFLGSELRAKWLLEGGPHGFQHYPTTDETPTADGVGRFASFQSGVIYWSPETDAHFVVGAIFGEWNARGREAGALGYPVSDEYDIAGGRRSDFQKGHIEWASATGVVTVVINP